VAGWFCDCRALQDEAIVMKQQTVITTCHKVTSLIIAGQEDNA